MNYVKTRIDARRRLHGSTLAMALLAVFILSFSAATVFYYISNRYQTAFQSASWNEALVVAESGVDTAMQTLNSSITSPNTAWTGWMPSDATTFPKTYSGVLPPHTGDGNNKMYISVTVDQSVTDSAGNIWPRITSSGTAEVPGLSRVGYAPASLSTAGAKSHNSLLRKLAFKTDVTGHALHLPQTTRTVQAIAKPLSTGIFKRAATVQTSISMSGSAVVDSFDSTNPAMSTNGQYDSAKQQSHGDIATNTDGSASDLKNTFVYGNASSNGGTIKNAGNVQGTVYNNFSSTIPPVSDPTFSTVVSSPTIVNGGAVTLTAGTQSAPANYVLSKLNVPANGSLTLAAPSPGQDSYINIWVTGDVTTNGNGFITVSPGVHATIWVDGNVNVKGHAFDNENGYAQYLQINGVTPADGSTNSYAVTGHAEFIGIVNAPAYKLTVSGGGDFVGAVIMNSINFSGSAGFHYDESLAGMTNGSGAGYQVASWIEDIP